MKAKDAAVKLKKIKLEPVYGSEYCQFSVVENKLATIYSNQEKILEAIKLAAEIKLKS